MKILMIKEPSILRDGIVHVLKDGFGEQEVLICDSKNKDKLLYEYNNVDLIIIDIDTNIDIIPTIKHFKNENKKVIVWASNLDNRQFITDLFNLDLEGYFYNGMEKEKVIYALKSVMDGNQYVHECLSSLLLNEYIQIQTKKNKKPIGIFSNREWEVLELLVKGCTNYEIGEFLFISEKTVKNHVSKILRKLDVPDRTNAVLTTLRNNWICL